MRSYRLSQLDLDSLNRWLTDKYGCGYYIGGKRAGGSTDSLWRIVWSDDQLENRTGIFRDVERTTGIFLREVEETRLIPKYPWVKARHILEKNIFAECPPLPDTMGKPHYEIIFVFWNAKTNEPIPIMKEGVEFLIKCMDEGAEAAARQAPYMNPGRVDQAEKEEDDAFEHQAADELNQDYSAVGSALADREAVTVPDMSLGEEE